MERVLESKGRRVTLGQRTLLMGIVNVTPDSFYDGGQHATTEQAIRHGLLLVEQGADILDIGGESTRPGSDPVSTSEELRRTLPVIEALAARVDVPISIDTVKAEVAERAITAGASWVNDISAGLQDPAILDLVAQHGVPYVAMHMRGTPKTMQKDTRYSDLLGEINRYFDERLTVFRAAGIRPEQLLLDPGIGFGKALEDNYLLLASLEELRRPGIAMLVGPSRKSFLKLVGGESIEDRLPGTLAVVTICALAGVDVVRVHDVAEARQAVRVAELVTQARQQRNG